MRKIPLHDRGGSVCGHARVDDEDYAPLAPFAWRKDTDGYAVRSRRAPGRGNVRMHRQIMDCTPGDGLEVDHIDRDRLNNQRSNLRVGVRAELGQNIHRAYGTSAYRGVSWDGGVDAWRATVVVGGKQILSRLFLDEHEAAMAAWRVRCASMPAAAHDPEPDPALACGLRGASTMKPRKSRRLNSEQVAEAFARKAKGHKQTAIARDLGISEGRLSEILSGKRYRERPRPLATQ